MSGEPFCEKLISNLLTIYPIMCADGFDITGIHSPFYDIYLPDFLEIYRFVYNENPEKIIWKWIDNAGNEHNGKWSRFLEYRIDLGESIPEKNNRYEVTIWKNVKIDLNLIITGQWEKVFSLYKERNIIPNPIIARYADHFDILSEGDYNSDYTINPKAFFKIAVSNFPEIGGFYYDYESEEIIWKWIDENNHIEFGTWQNYLRYKAQKGGSEPPNKFTDFKWNGKRLSLSVIFKGEWKEFLEAYHLERCQIEDLNIGVKYC